MVKAVVGDEAHLKALEETLSSSSSSSPQAQVGLVVGKLSASSDRALVYSLVPTPPTDADAPACSLRASSSSSAAKPKSSTKGPSASAPSLEFDVDWVAEHARQVSRMLLGGMSVIGVYIWAPEASFKATSPAVLSQVIRAVSHAWYGSGFAERLLLHISYSPRRWACRICEIASGNLRPCDFKYRKLLASLQTFRCTYNFETRLTVVRAEPFKKVILKAINHLTEEVQNAKALIDGDLDATERCKEVISLETVAESSSILEPESAAECATLDCFWHMVPGVSRRASARSSLKDSQSGQRDDSSRSQGSSSFNILAALFALLVALIVGFVLSFSANWST